MTSASKQRWGPRWVRSLWLALASLCVAAGAIGVVLPGLPTTPFLLVAAWAAPKGSPKLAAWLHNHPKFGPMLDAWHTQRAVPFRAKVAAVLLMSFSWSLLWIVGVPLMFIALSGLFFLALSAFLITRPLPHVDDRQQTSQKAS